MESLQRTVMAYIATYVGLQFIQGRDSYILHEVL
jgi:hypothetical protein